MMTNGPSIINGVLSFLQVTQGCSHLILIQSDVAEAVKSACVCYFTTGTNLANEIMREHRYYAVKHRPVQIEILNP